MDGSLQVSLALPTRANIYCCQFEACGQFEACRGAQMLGSIKMTLKTLNFAIYMYIRPLDKSAYQKIIFLFPNQKICCGYSKETSQ